MSAHRRDAAGQSPRPWAWLGRGLRTMAIAYLMLVVAAMICENRLVYFPSPYPDGDWRPPLPGVEDAWFEAADGVRLHGWYAGRERPRAVVLFCHGNGGNVAYWSDVLVRLHAELNTSVLLFDYRGYGRSEGTPDENGLYRDARAARRWLAEKAGVAENEIVLMGRSLGGAVAVDLAARDGARALVLESTFTRLPDVAAFHYRWLPVRFLMRNRFDSQAKIGNYHGPLLVSHGTEDTIVPYEFGRRLFEAANEPKQFFSISGGEHNELPGRAHDRALAAFLDSL